MPYHHMIPLYYSFVFIDSSGYETKLDVIPLPSR